MRRVIAIGCCLAMSSIAAAQGEADAPVTVTDMPADAPAGVPATHIVRDGETLWDITQRYYRNPYAWPRVWSYNPDVTNPHWIYPGLEIRLVGDQVDAQPTGEASPGITRTKYEYRQGKIYLRDVGFLDKEALGKVGHVIAGRDDHMLLTTHQRVYLRFKDGVAPKPGTHYTVFRHIRKKERLKKEKGHLVRILGTIRLDDYDHDKNVGRAWIVEALEPIERGYPVAPMMRRIDPVAPVASKANLEGKVIASVFPRQLLGQNQVIFVNLGSEDGLTRGNQLYALRQGDEWRDATKGTHMDISNTVKLPKQPKSYPTEIVGYGTVVNVRPKTAAVLITQATRALVFGDRLVTRRGK